MKLEEIGFYTLSDARVTCDHDCIMRCEIVITRQCNFKCPYCRGIESKTVSLEEVKSWIDIINKDGIYAIRFTGGEPTLHPDLLEIVKYAKKVGVTMIAISTNGSADISYYKKLIDNGVNDFSISLDACCSEVGHKMCGIDGAWEKVIENIKELSKLCYVTVGVVIHDKEQDPEKIIQFAHDLGVADIRIISSAQTNDDIKVKDIITNNHPILKYRLSKHRPLRGIFDNDCFKCPLVLDDVAILNGLHYPCIIYMREKGMPIEELNKDFKIDREKWFLNHNTKLDPICKKNCLDVCVEYNNKWCNQWN